MRLRIGVALEIAGAGDPQLGRDLFLEEGEGSVGHVTGADSLGQRAPLGLGRPGLLGPELTGGYSERVHGDERAESQPGVVEPRQDLLLQELTDRFDQLVGSRTIVGHAAFSIKSSSSYSISAASRPS